jgi:PAS domain S-box-containing protein
MNQMLAVAPLKIETGGWRSPLKPGLNRTLVGWFLVLALVPLTLVSGFSYQQARNSLEESAFEALEASTTQKGIFVDNWFHYRFLDLEVQATSLKITRFLEILRSGLEESRKPVGEFVGSYQWALLVDNYDSDLYSFRRTYGYYDVLLMDSDGNILFTVSGEADLGTNLFHGAYSSTRFARASRLSLDSGQAAFSDYEFYAPSDNAVAGFLVSPIIDDNGEKIGLVAFKIPVDRIDAIMRVGAGSGQTGESYLVGVDGLARSNSVLIKEGTILNRLIDTSQISSWRERLVSGRGDASPDGNRNAFVYKGPNDKPVLGLIRTVKIADITWGLVAEIEEKEALAEVERLGKIVALLAAVTLVVVLVVAVSIANRIVTPLQILSATTRRVAEGWYDQEISLDFRNEIGELALSLRNMLVALREARSAGEVDNWLKTGAVRMADVLRGDQSVSSLSANAVSFMCRYAGAQMASVYLVEQGGRTLRQIAAYAFNKSRAPGNQIGLGEGIAGQAALEREMIILSGVPEDYLHISSLLGSAVPRTIVASPLLHADSLIGVVEFAWLEDLSDAKKTFLRSALDNMAIALGSGLMQETLLENEMKTRSIVETATDAIVTIDSKGIIQSVNDSTERMFGYDTTELIGENIAILSAEPGATAPEDYVSAFMRADAGKTNGSKKEVRARRRDGTVFPALLSVGEAKITGGSSFHGFFQDISAQKEAELEITDRNERLETQARELHRSREKLSSQQEELRQNNEELVIQAQRNVRQNKELHEAQRILEERASELEQASKYKSEFLANMSHELRTPLNSLLVLSQLLQANKEGNLNDKQIESIETIHAGGKDLLLLINDILDLSKVEAGMIDFVVERVNLQNMADEMRRQFKSVIQQRGLDLSIEVDPELPSDFYTDHQRVSQILKNLMSNAIKFTSRGSVTLSVFRPSANEDSGPEFVSDRVIAFSVSDTGIGIAADKQGRIFEAFVQADGSTSRKYGGTGLGLSISKRLAKALGGEIRVQSVEDEGSRFTLLLPGVPPENLARKSFGRHRDAGHKQTMEV